MGSLLHARIKNSIKTVDAIAMPGSKKAMAVKSAGKVMASVFWDADGILMIDYLSKGQKINGEYYANLLDNL
ncbi:hypothetical protein F3G63_34020, partial [Pseudomonas aeruginosa]